MPDEAPVMTAQRLFNLISRGPDYRRRKRSGDPDSSSIALQLHRRFRHDFRQERAAAIYRHRDDGRASRRTSGFHLARCLQVENTPRADSECLCSKTEIEVDAHPVDRSE